MYNEQSCWKGNYERNFIYNSINIIKYRGMSLNKFKQGGERPVQQKL